MMMMLMISIVVIIIIITIIISSSSRGPAAQPVLALQADGADDRDAQGLRSRGRFEAARPRLEV